MSTSSNYLKILQKNKSLHAMKMDSFDKFIESINTLKKLTSLDLNLI